MQCPISLPGNTARGVFTVRILEWFATQSSSASHSVRLSTILVYGWPYVKWRIASLSYVSPFATTRLIREKRAAEDKTVR